MKKYSTLLLSSTMLLISCVCTPTVAAYSSYERWSHSTTASSDSLSSSPNINETTVDPTFIQQPLSAQIHNDSLSIFYNRTESQQDKTIMFAIWSEENGQDDLRWYKAEESVTSIPITPTTNNTTYIIHSYIIINNRLTFLEEGHVTQTNSSVEATEVLNPPLQPEITTSLTSPGLIDIQINHLPETTSEVKVPVWSINNGQDDLIWYPASRHHDGSYRVQVDISNHRLDTGTYAIHVYAKTQANTSLSFITSADIEVTKEHLPINQEPQLAIQNLDTTNGNYQVQVTPPPTGKTIQKIDVATWSTDNQSNLKWRIATYQNGYFTTDVRFSEHQNISGVYQNHVYITYTDGSRVGYATELVDLTKARAATQATTVYRSQGLFQVTFDNIYDSGNVSYAVWSDENGQDDLRWYVANKAGNRTYTGNIPLEYHKGSGVYHLHVYQNGKGLLATTFQVSTAQLPIPKTSPSTGPNTYPVGQCTWGAKELAPWIPNYLGHAKYWANNAKGHGFQVGTSPRVGAIAVWTDGQFGHVGVVTAVDSSNRIRIKESNFNGHQYVGDFRGWFNPVSAGITAYIYPH